MVLTGDIIMNNKVNDFINKEYSDIIAQTREMRAFNLGTANGYYQLYKYIKDEIGKDSANKCFKSCFEATDEVSKYFTKMIELSEEQDKETEDIKNDIITREDS
jgi:DNA-binding ferritin-like protein